MQVHVAPLFRLPQAGRPAPPVLHSTVTHLNLWGLPGLSPAPDSSRSSLLDVCIVSPVPFMGNLLFDVL